MLKNRRAPGPTINKAQCLKLLPFQPRVMLLSKSLLAYLGIHEAATTNTPYLWGLRPALGKKKKKFSFSRSAKGKLKLTMFHCYPRSSQAEPCAGIAKQSLQTVTGFTIEFASYRLHYLLKL